MAGSPGSPGRRSKMVHLESLSTLLGYDCRPFCLTGTSFPEPFHCRLLSHFDLSVSHQTRKLWLLCVKPYPTWIQISETISNLFVESWPECTQSPRRPSHLIEWEPRSGAICWKRWNRKGLWFEAFFLSTWMATSYFARLEMLHWSRSNL